MDGITGENTSYTYDALNRLTGATNSLWNGTYSYDGFGNLTGKSGSGGSPNGFPTMSAAYNANNQLTTASYDADGNTTSSNGYTYGYTVENKRRSQTSTTWPYPVTLYGNDPKGRRVMKETNPDPLNYEGENNPLWEFYFYTITGQRLLTIDCDDANAQYQPKCWPVGENIYFGKRLLVSNGVYVATDRLGTVRANTQGESYQYYPFGEERSNQPDGRDKFATYFRDGVGQDYAQQRYYNAGMGRFWSVDPGGMMVAHVGNPTSWNHYAYAFADPINFSDPIGKDACEDGSDECSDADCGDAEDPCEASDSAGGGDSESATDPCTNSTATFCVTATGQMPLDPNPTPPLSTASALPIALPIIEDVGEGIGAAVCIGSGACEIAGTIAGVGAVLYGVTLLANSTPVETPSPTQMGALQGNHWTGVAQALVQAGRYQTLCNALAALEASAASTKDRLAIRQAMKFAGCANKRKARH